MNCEDFNNIINELADYKPMDATTRDDGVSHVALCADCATRLANARAISSALLLAAGAESEAAPSSVRENLLAAFAAPQQAERAPVNVVPISSRLSPGWWTAAAVALAAAIVLAVTLTVWKRAPTTNPPQSIASKPVNTPAATPDIVRPADKSGSDRPVKTISGVSVKPRALKARRAIPANTNETVARNTANEYVPLAYLASATAIDSGTIVRVQLSRAALARLGLPLNIEGSSDSIRAEVVIGDDGVARAIRLVQ